MPKRASASVCIWAREWARTCARVRAFIVRWLMCVAVGAWRAFLHAPACDCKWARRFVVFFGHQFHASHLKSAASLACAANSNKNVL
jgi:hypothetical protein